LWTGRTARHWNSHPRSFALRITARQFPSRLTRAGALPVASAVFHVQPRSNSIASRARAARTSVVPDEVPTLQSNFNSPTHPAGVPVHSSCPMRSIVQEVGKRGAVPNRACGLRIHERMQKGSGPGRHWLNQVCSETPVSNCGVDAQGDFLCPLLRNCSVSPRAQTCQRCRRY